MVAATVLTCRTFLNSDTPALVDVWQRQPPLRGLACGMTAVLFEELVLARPWFDPEGLLVGCSEGRVAGFAHAGFGPVLDGSALDRRQGVLCQVRLLDSGQAGSLGLLLVESGLSYLRSHGATSCHAVSRFPHAPFYLGLYGGSRLPGVLADDKVMQQSLAAGGFSVAGEIGIFHRGLAGYRSPVDRRLLSVKRNFEIVAEPAPRPESWWEGGLLTCEDQRVRFSLFDRGKNRMVATLISWEIQPLSSSWGVRTSGLCELQVMDQHRRAGLATCLVSEVLRVLAQEGAGNVEVQIALADQASCGVFAKLGFQQVDLALQMSRPLA